MPSSGGWSGAVTYPRNIFHDTSEYTTRKTGELILSSYQVPANTFSSTLTSFRVVQTIYKSNTSNGTSNVKWYINSSNSLSGAKQIAALDLAATFRMGSFCRRFTFYNGTVRGWNSTDAITVSDEVAGFSASRVATTFSYNVAKAIYFIQTVNLASSSDTFGQSLYHMQENRAP